MRNMTGTLILYSEVKFFKNDFHKLATTSGFHVHFKISILLFWDHPSAVKLNLDYLLVTHQKKKKEKSSLFSVFTASPGSVGEILSFSTSELELVPHGKTPNNL